MSDGMSDTVTLPVEGQPGYMDAQRIVRHTRRMQTRYRKRDGRWDDIRAIRRGDFENTPFQEFISETFQKPIIANTIDTCARDLAEMLAPMPSINCSSASMRSDAERKRADIRTKIAGHYVNHSRLAEQLLYSTDHYFTHSFSIAYVEADRKAFMPRIVVEDPLGGYPTFDRWNRLLTYTKRWFIESGILADLYPEHAGKIYAERKDYAGNTYDTQIELIRFWDDKGRTLVMASKQPVILEHVPNVIPGVLPMVLARKPWLDYHHEKGQFDDVLWVQMAKDGLAKLQYEGVSKSVQAPLAVPTDVQEVPYGGDALLRSATPEKIRRVGMEMTNMTFIEGQNLGQELLDGARYPAARATGNMDASIITGRGVQALMGGLESQIKAGQVVYREFLIDLLGLCFRMDEKVWPDTKKRIHGNTDGTPYDLEYTPSIDIRGSFTVDCQYGFAAGLDPNRAAVLLLQMQSAGVVSRDFLGRQQPFGLNVTEEQAKIVIEHSRDSIAQGIYAMNQAIPAMVAQGMDPTEVLRRSAEFVKLVMKGQTVEMAALDAFKPLPPPKGSQVPGEGPPEEGGPAGAPGQLPPGMEPTGLMQGVAPGQAGSPPGGRPDLSVAMAGLTSSGKPQMTSSVSRRRAV